MRRPGEQEWSLKQNILLLKLGKLCKRKELKQETRRTSLSTHPIVLNLTPVSRPAVVRTSRRERKEEAKVLEIKPVAEPLSELREAESLMKSPWQDLEAKINPGHV